MSDKKQPCETSFVQKTPTNTKIIIINDTDKNMRATDLDKVDVISEWFRKLKDMKIYLKLTEENLKI